MQKFYNTLKRLKEKNIYVKTCCYFLQQSFFVNPIKFNYFWLPAVKLYGFNELKKIGANKILQKRKKKKTGILKPKSMEM